MKSAGGTSHSVSLSLPDGRGATEPVSVRYEVAGEGPPVVLLHGIGLDASDVSWRYALPALAQSHRVYAPDFPGHGESDKPNHQYTTDYFRASVDAFIDAVGADAPALGGVSMGGCVALDYALDNPVEHLVLVNSYGLGGDAHWRAPAWALLRTPFAHAAWWRTIGSSKAAVTAHLDHLTDGTPPAELVSDVHGVVQESAVGRTVSSWQRSEFRADGFRTDHSERLEQLEAETLFVHGVADPLVPPAWSERAAAQVPDSRLELLDGAGHWTPRELPQRFTELVRTFLN